MPLLPVFPVAVRSNAWCVVVLFLALGATACSKQDSTSGAKGGNAAAQPAAQPMPVSVIEMRPQRVPIVLEGVGQTEGSKAVEVRARVGGILQKQLYREGEPVRAGAPMFQIDRAPYEIALQQARAAAQQDQARIEQTRRDVERLKPLAADRAVSQKEYDDALSASQLAQASVQQSLARVREADLNLSYTLVSAPVAGEAGRAEHSEGSLITTDANGSLLTTINQLDPMWVRFSLAQSDLAKLPNGRLDRNTGASVTLLMSDGKPYPRPGQLNFAATQIDPRLGTQQLRASFPNPAQQLLPGDFVRVRIAAGDRDNVFLVPQSAVVQTEKTFLVFVVEDGKATSRPVQTGDWYGNNWTILSGIKAGDRVIVDNLSKIRPGASVTPQVVQAANANAPAASPGTTAASSSTTASGNAVPK